MGSSELVDFVFISMLSILSNVGEGKVLQVACGPKHVGLDGHVCKRDVCNGDVCNGQGQHLKKTQVVRFGCRRLIVDGLECFVNPYQSRIYTISPSVTSGTTDTPWPSRALARFA